MFYFAEKQVLAKPVTFGEETCTGLGTHMAPADRYCQLSSSGARAGVVPAAPRPPQRGMKPLPGSGELQRARSIETLSVLGLSKPGRDAAVGRRHCWWQCLPRPLRCLGATVLPGPRPAATAGGVGCSPQPSVDLPAGGTLRQWESRCRRTARSHRCHGHWPPEHPSSEHPLPAPPRVRLHAAGRFPGFLVILLLGSLVSCSGNNWGLLIKNTNRVQTLAEKQDFGLSRERCYSFKLAVSRRNASS